MNYHETSTRALSIGWELPNAPQKLTASSRLERDPAPTMFLPSLPSFLERSGRGLSRLQLTFPSTAPARELQEAVHREWKIPLLAQWLG